MNPAAVAPFGLGEEQRKRLAVRRRTYRDRTQADFH